MLYRVYQGKATHKQAFLWFERTNYQVLVREGGYLIHWYPKGLREKGTAHDGQAVKEVIADITRSGEKPRHFYVLVRGIGESEQIFRGYSTSPGAATLRMTSGDLLIIDPSPTHVLFQDSAAPAGE